MRKADYKAEEKKRQKGMRKPFLSLSGHETHYSILNTPINRAYLKTREPFSLSIEYLMCDSLKRTETLALYRNNSHIMS